MKHIVIFEGIASSGKTTLERLLSDRLPNSNTISEGSTLMPIIDNKDQKVALEHLHHQLQTIVSTPAENVIVDRFHFTHIFRTRSTLKDFSKIEDELQKIGQVIVVLLTIIPEKIKERIEETTHFRKDDWKKGAQGSVEEKAAYYTGQQKVLKNLASSSRLPTYVIDTTAKDWEAYVETILTRMNF